MRRFFFDFCLQNVHNLSLSCSYLFIRIKISKERKREARKTEMNKDIFRITATKKYEVWIKKWSEEHKAQIRILAGEFAEYMNANLFAQAYADYYNATVEILEYRKLGTHEITPNL